MKSTNGNGGFSLIEVLIVTGILVLIGTTLGGFQKDLWVQNSFIQNSIIAESEARGAVKNFIAELRAATAADNGAYAIGLASSTAITFYSDLDRDGSRERVRYYYLAGTLMKGVTQPSGTPAAYVDANEKKQIVVHTVTNGGSGLFTYYGDIYDAFGTTTPLTFPVDIMKIRHVAVLINIDADPTRSPLPMSFQSRVTLRNIKDNL
jgi:type II secretory pathway pseudopilin PulG